MHTKNLVPVDQNDEIHTKFKDTPYPPDVLDDFSRIQSILTTDVITKHFKILELELEKRLREKNAPIKDGKIPNKDKNIKKYPGQYRVLTEFMREWGEKNGFNLSHTVPCIEKNSKGVEERVNISLPNTIPVIFDLLTTDVFANLFLNFAYLSKDIGAGVSHGEFSHFLQLYIIFEEYKQNKFLKNDPLTLIKMSGDFVANKETLWGIALDKNPGSGSFSDPDFLNADINYVRTKQDFKNATAPELDIKQFPLLAQMISGRTKKREPNYRYNPRNFFQSYINPDTQVKYRDKNGLIVNDAVYFETADKYPRRVIFDDIRHELELYQNLFNKIETKLPNIPDNIPVIDRLSKLFDASNYKLRVKNELEDVFELANKDLKIIQKKLSNPGTILHHRDVINLLEKVISRINTANDEARPYARSAVAFTLNMIQQLEANLEAKPESNFKPR